MTCATLWGWFSDTWFSGEFWRQLVSGIIGVFVGAWLAFLVERSKARKEAKARAAEAEAARHERETLAKREIADREAGIRLTLADGVIRNLASIEHMVELLAKRDQIPSLRFTSGHFEVVLLPAAEVFERAPGVYGRLVDAHQTLEQVNKRLDQVFAIELAYFIREGDRSVKAEMSGYRSELLESLKHLEAMLRAVLVDSGAASRLADLRSATPAT